MTALRWEMLISGVGGALIIFMAGYDAARISSKRSYRWHNWRCGRSVSRHRLVSS